MGSVVGGGDEPFVQAGSRRTMDEEKDADECGRGGSMTVVV